MESKSRLICQLCQEETDHATPNCPTLKCFNCGQNGHAKKDCSSLPGESKNLPNKRKIEAIEAPECSKNLDTKVPKVIFDKSSVLGNPKVPMISKKSDMKDVKQRESHTVEAK